MVIYYCQGTDSSLSVQYSLQGSIFKIFFSRPPQSGGYTVVLCTFLSNCIGENIFNYYGNAYSNVSGACGGTTFLNEVTPEICSPVSCTAPFDLWFRPTAPARTIFKRFTKKTMP